MVTTVELEPGTRLGAFELEEPLGEGGMGAVYLGRDTALDRPVALKVLPPRLARDGEYVERFVREARTAAKLNHPNVVQIYGAGFEKDRGLAFMALELVPGGTLQQLVSDRDGPLPTRRACEIVRDAARGLAAAHDLGIVHRDLKPDNVLLTPTGEVKLADFGLAYSCGSQRITASGTFLGTPQYSSPEQCEGGFVGRASDLYSLGVVLYELLTGELPYEAPTPLALLNKILTGPVPILADARPELPKSLLAVSERLLQKDPEARYGSAEELVADLDKVLAGLPADDPADPVPAPRSADPGSAVAATVLQSPGGRGTTKAGPAAAGGVPPEASALLASFGGGDGGPYDPPVRKMVGRLGALGGALALVLVGLLAWSMGFSPPATRPGRVAVVGWDADRSSDFAWLADAIPDFVRAELGEGGVEVVDGRAVAEALADGQGPQAAARAAHADFWIEGRILEDSSDVAVLTRVHAVADGRQVETQSVRFSRDAVLEHVDRLGAELARFFADEGRVPAVRGQATELAAAEDSGEPAPGAGLEERSAGAWSALDAEGSMDDALDQARRLDPRENAEAEGDAKTERRGRGARDREQEGGEGVDEAAELLRLEGGGQGDGGGAPPASAAGPGQQSTGGHAGEFERSTLGDEADAAPAAEPAADPGDASVADPAGDDDAPAPPPEAPPGPAPADEVVTGAPEPDAPPAEPSEPAAEDLPSEAAQPARPSPCQGLRDRAELEPWELLRQCQLALETGDREALAGAVELLEARDGSSDYVDHVLARVRERLAD